MIFDIFDMDNAFQMRCGKSVIGGDRRRGRCFVARRSQDHLMYQFFPIFAWLLGSLVCAIDLWTLWKHITRRTWIGGLYSTEMHVFNEKTNVHVFMRVRVLLMLEGSYKLFLNHTRVSQHLFIHLLSLGLYPVPENSKFRLGLQMSYLTIDNIGEKIYRRTCMKTSGGWPMGVRDRLTRERRESKDVYV